MNSKYFVLLFTVLMFVSEAGFGQRNRFNFAQTYLGIQTDYLCAGDAGPDFAASRILIGGSHFWYRADFYIGFPLSAFALSETTWRYSEGVITGGRYLPFGPGQKIPHPYIGASWMTPTIRIGKGPAVQRNRLGLDVGLSLVIRKRHSIEGRVQYQHNATLDYATSRESFVPITPPTWTFGLVFKKYFDTTAGNSRPEAQAWISSAEQTFESRGVLSTWSLDVGLTANVTGSGFTFSDAPFLPARPEISLAPDLSVGYYFHLADLGVRASYRPFHIAQEGHGYAWGLWEHRTSLEVYKFLFDYHGFVPFAGFSLGGTYQNFDVRDRDRPHRGFTGWSPAVGLVFGWDIRPTAVDWFILRTNLRFNTAVGPKPEAINLRSTHLEVNFIQMVVYPQRLLNLKYVKP